MPGLLRGVARTAVVAGTATAVSDRVRRRQAHRWAQQDAMAAPQAYAAPPPAYAAAPPPAAPVPPPRTDTDTKLAQLRELGRLRDSGVLDEAEFQLQKSRILDS
ncbi:SHOCT domain-containing protein [Geodermatophilus sp. SYSU D01045]